MYLLGKKSLDTKLEASKTPCVQVASTTPHIRFAWLLSAAN